MALGAIFLVKFSIDRGLLSPVVRILLGLLFSGTLIAIGEWARRRGAAFSFNAFAKANIPAILTAAGTMGAFATLYAAYELYQLLSPLVAFIGLGIIGVGTTIIALLHGPLLAVLGIFGKLYLANTGFNRHPFSAGACQYISWPFLHQAFVVGRLRLWKWLAVSIAAGLIIYGVLLHTISAHDISSDRLFITAYIVAAWCMISYVFIISLYEKSLKIILPIGQNRLCVGYNYAVFDIGKHIIISGGFSEQHLVDGRNLWAFCDGLLF